MKHASEQNLFILGEEVLVLVLCQFNSYRDYRIPKLNSLNIKSLLVCYSFRFRILGRVLGILGDKALILKHRLLVPKTIIISSNHPIRVEKSKSG